MRRLSSGEIRQMLRDSAWRMVREAWDAEIQEQSKLGVVKGLLECGCQSRCVDVGSKRIQRMLAKLRGGTAELRVETGRWNGLKKELPVLGPVPWAEMQRMFLRPRAG